MPKHDAGGDDLLQPNWRTTENSRYTAAAAGTSCRLVGGTVRVSYAGKITMLVGRHARDVQTFKWGNDNIEQCDDKALDLCMHKHRQ